MPAHISSAGSTWPVVLRHALLLGAAGHVWAQFDPGGFTTAALPLTKAALTAAAGWGLWRLARPFDRVQSPEDLCCGWYITGKPGTGKTGYVYRMVWRWASLGWPWILMSCKSTIEVLQYLPERAIGRTTVIQPDGPRPIGIDLMRLYTHTAQERELVADQVAELYSRLHSAMSDIMREVIRLGCLALLRWASEEGVQVSPYEIYRLFQDGRFRERVLANAPGPIRDGLDPESVRPQTWQAVTTQLRRAVTSDSLLLGLCQPGGVDLWEWMQGSSGLVIDAPSGRLGPSISAFICRAIAARIQLLQERRPGGSAPALVALDEFQRYASSSFASAVEVGRQYRMAWCVCHQTHAGQDLGQDVAGVVEMIGNHILFQQGLRDARRAAELVGGRWTPDQLQLLPKRRYVGVMRIGDVPTIVHARTKPLQAPNPELAAEILAQNQQGPTREALLKAILSRRVERGGAGRGDVQPA